MGTQTVSNHFHPSSLLSFSHIIEVSFLENRDGVGTVAVDLGDATSVLCPLVQQLADLVHRQGLVTHETQHQLEGRVLLLDTLLL